MSDCDILNSIKNCQMRIAPYDEKKLTPVGYDFSFSRFIISLKTKSFQKIFMVEDEMYFILKPNETVLVLTNEAIWVSNEIGGTFHSRVSLVTQGLGHVSTTLDPGWQGQLLIPINNLTKKDIKVTIGKKVTNNGEEIFEYDSFITLILYKAISPAIKPSCKKASRYEILKKIMTHKKSSRYNDDVSKAVADMELEITKNEIDFTKVNSQNVEEYMKNFDKKYEYISRQNDVIYNQVINKATDKMTKNNKFYFVSIIFLMIVTVAFVFGLGYVKTELQWMSTALSTIMTAVYIVSIKPIRDYLEI
ncbi:MAG: hypothetical protein FWG55_04830 [Candidatus Bathyarchaeota archaeon]|nr:hypothetical protein [Candidatus Termiticorpusculum sp.]